MGFTASQFRHLRMSKVARRPCAFTWAGAGGGAPRERWDARWTDRGPPKTSVGLYFTTIKQRPRFRLDNR